MTVYSRQPFRPVRFALLAGTLASILSQSVGAETPEEPQSELSLGRELTLSEFGFTGTFTRQGGEPLWTGSWPGGCANTTFRLVEGPSLNIKGLSPAGQTIVLLREDGDKETCPFSPGLRAEYHLKASISGTMVKLEGKRTITNPGAEPSLSWLKGNVADVTGSATLTPGSQPTVEPPEPTRPTGQKISDTEIEGIVSWGIKNNRTPEDIQKDVNERNESLGGSGTVPLPLKLQRMIYKPEKRAGMFSVTVTEKEMEAIRILDSVSNIKKELARLEKEAAELTALDMNASYQLTKLVAAPVDLFDMATVMQYQIKPYGEIDYTYGRPTPQRLMGIETPESVEAYRQWQASENGKKAAAEKKRVVKEFHEAMQNALKTSGVPSDHPSVTHANKTTLRLSELLEKQEKLILEMRKMHSQYNIPELREMKIEVEQRARRGVGRLGGPTD